MYNCLILSVPITALLLFLHQLVPVSGQSGDLPKRGWSPVAITGSGRTDCPDDRTVHTLLDANVTTLTPQFFLEHQPQRVKISHGPFTVPSMNSQNGMMKYKEASTTLPCTDCLITWMQAGLEFTDGTVADAETGMWLHHTVFSNLRRPDAVCPDEKHGDRFFASGNERTPVNICLDGTEHAGYYVGPDDEIGMTVELMNMVDEPRDAVLTMTYEYLPSIPDGFDTVKTYWLDIGGCGSSSFPAEPSTTFKYASPPWKSSLDGRVTFVASHLHDGGTNIELTSNGHIICDARAIYGSCDNPASTGACMQHISNVSVCKDLGPTYSEDEWSIVAYYDTSKYTPMKDVDGNLEPIMGISILYVAEAEDETTRHHHKRRVNRLVLGFGFITGVTVLVMIWRRTNRLSSFKDVLLLPLWDLSNGDGEREMNRSGPFPKEYHDED